MTSTGFNLKFLRVFEKKTPWKARSLSLSLSLSLSP